MICPTCQSTVHTIPNPTPITPAKNTNERFQAHHAVIQLPHLLQQYEASGIAVYEDATAGATCLRDVVTAVVNFHVIFHFFAAK